MLSGKEVVLSQGDNVLVGCKLTVADEEAGWRRFDGCAGGASRMSSASP